MKKSIHVKNITILLIVSIFSSCQQQSKIPFPEAINNSEVVQEDISSIIENGIIIGNGDITGLVYRKDNMLAINLSKNDIGDWRNDTQEDNSIMPWEKIRSDAKQGIFKELPSRKILGWHNYPYPTPIPCGKVLFELENVAKSMSKLDVRNAEVVISPEGNLPKLEICALAQKNVFLVKGGNTINLLSHQVKHLDPANKTVDGDLQVLYQKLPDIIDFPGMEYAVALLTKGEFTTVAVVSSFDHPSPKEEAIKLAKEALENPQKEKEMHQKSWDEFWSQSGIQLEDKYLESVWYRNLYFFRSVSKDNCAPPGLFAGMIDDGTPAWHSSHTLNYNAQQRNWGAFASNHIDQAGSYQWLIERYMDNARWLCKTLFGFEGVYFPHNIFTHQTDHATSKQNGNGVHMHVPWGYSVGITGWVFQNIWWQYEYAPDTVFLRNTVYPMLKESALFYSSFIESCDVEDNGKVLFGPSVSPEHYGFTENLKLNWNDTHGLVYARFALETAIEADNILNTDKTDVVLFKKALEKLPEYPTYGKGENEVIVAVKNAEPIVYNVPIPCFPVFPSERVTWFSEEGEKNQLERSIAQAKSNGNNDAVITSIARSRLSMDDAYSYAVKVCKDRQRPNGTLTLNVLGKNFNDFGHYTEQFAATAIVSELLIQSVNNIIRVFPAWDKTKNAQFQSLRAKGGFLVSSSLTNGECDFVEIKSTVGGNLKVLCPREEMELTLNGKKINIQKNKSGIVEIATEAKDIILLKNQS